MLNDVKGKSNRAIVPKSTVLTDELITILDKFLIMEVDVASKLSDGTIFVPKVVKQEKQTNDSRNITFKEHYQSVVKGYKMLFTAWQKNIQFDMPTVRKLFIPLLDRVGSGDVNIFTMHQYNIKEDYNYHHSVAIGLLAAYLGKKMGYNHADYVQIGLAGFLSDCGMSKVSPTILTKTDTLSAIEINEMKKHPTYSYRMVEHIPTITQIVKLAILQHHERMDGSGYPLAVKKDKIHAYARIIAVSDRYHAMTCEQLYQEKQSPFQVMDGLIQGKYTHFDHQVVETFGKCFAYFSKGSKVRLSTGDTGKIVFVEDRYPTRPMVKLDQSGEILALKNNVAIYIDEIIET